MKKYRNIFSLLLVVVMLFTACGTAETAEEPAATQEATEEAVTDEPAGEYAGMGDGKTLTYWACWNETETQAEAIKRIKWVAPQNCKRIGFDTPCVEDGQCHNCMHFQRSCCTSVTLNYSRIPDRITVILVGEDLGV